MASFFDKLKKGMGIDEPISEPEEEKEEEKEEEEVKKKPAKKPRKAKKPKKEAKTPEIKIEEIEIQEEEKEEPEEKEELEEKKKEEPEKPKEEKRKKWPSFGGMEEGELAIDVYQTDKDLIIQSAIAGVDLEDLDISIERDIITIRGGREKPFEENGDYFIQECFWGPFSKEIILPAEADPGRAAAEMKNGVLTIRIPKIIRETKKKIVIKKH